MGEQPPPSIEQLQRDLREIRAIYADQGFKIDRIHDILAGNEAYKQKGHAQRLLELEEWQEKWVGRVNWFIGAWAVISAGAIVFYEWIKSKIH